jgi:hypothetical protein
MQFWSIGMPTVVRFRVTSPFLAVGSSQQGGFVTIPRGAVIETSDDLREPGLHLMKLGPENLFAFARDIEERTEPMDLVAAAERDD